MVSADGALILAIGLLVAAACMGLGLAVYGLLGMVRRRHQSDGTGPTMRRWDRW